MSREPQRWGAWLCALFLAWLASSVILFFGSGLRHYLGQKALVAIERLMGMVLVTVAVQMLLTGMTQVEAWK
ncbi:MAG: MarC family protein, partial [candidate division NC10 bacterium]|nr:MarC family protein [candidate division NC10 bacterium]